MLRILPKVLQFRPKVLSVYLFIYFLIDLFIRKTPDGCRNRIVRVNPAYPKHSKGTLFPAVFSDIVLISERVVGSAVLCQALGRSIYF